jgi:hypothetical protein
VSDVRTEREAIAFGNTVTRLIAKLAEDSHNRIHVSLAGGRKTMGWYAGAALSLFGRDRDELSHVLVDHIAGEPEALEGCEDFWWPTENDEWIPHRYLRDADGNPRLFNARNGRIDLARIPFVRLKHILSEDAFPKGEIDYEAIVHALAESLSAYRLRLVMSLRQVDWRSFRINYFIVVAPGVLDDAPQSRLAAATLPLGREQEIQDQIIAQFPNITFVDIRSMLKRISNLLSKLGLGVRFLGGFTALAGLLILFGSVAATSVRRSGDLALLKALGFTRWGAASVLLAELGLTGLVAGVLGSLCAGLASWLVATQLLDVDPHLFPSTHIVVVLSVLVATCSAGTVAAFEALRRSPAEVFRNDVE